MAQGPVAEECFSLKILQGYATPYPAIAAILRIVAEDVDLAGWNGGWAKQNTFAFLLVADIFKGLRRCHLFTVNVEEAIVDGNIIFWPSHGTLDVNRPGWIPDDRGYFKHNDIANPRWRKPVGEFTNSYHVVTLVKLALQAVYFMERRSVDDFVSYVVIALFVEDLDPIRSFQQHKVIIAVIIVIVHCHLVADESGRH